MSAEIVVWLAELPASPRDGARDFLRVVLGRRLGCPAPSVPLTREASGKPRLAGEAARRLEFSLSHSAARALVALSEDRPVGVDLEPVDRSRPVTRLAERRFSAAEHARVRDAPDPAEVFYRLWAIKEACVKATGEGIGALHRVEIDRDFAQAEWDAPRWGARRWRVQELALGAGWAAAVAAPGTDWRAALRECEPD